MSGYTGIQNEQTTTQHELKQNIYCEWQKHKKRLIVTQVADFLADIKIKESIEVFIV